MQIHEYLVAEIRESPYVGQVYSKSNNGEQEVQIVIPCNAIISFNSRHLRTNLEFSSLTALILLQEIRPT